MKNSNDTTRNRTRDLPACSSAPFFYNRDGEKYLLIDLTWYQTQNFRILHFSDELVSVIYLLVFNEITQHEATSHFEHAGR